MGSVQVSGWQRQRPARPEVPSQVERAFELRGSAGVWIQRGHGRQQSLPSVPFRGEGGHQCKAKYEPQCHIGSFASFATSGLFLPLLQWGQKVWWKRIECTISRTTLARPYVDINTAFDHCRNNSDPSDLVLVVGARSHF